MIILIGGASHIGKTYLAQRLMEKLKITYLSLDHIKMGLIRGGIADGFSVADKDEVISEKMWPVIDGIIRTNIENEQNIIIEGCYLPQKQVKKLKEEYIGVIWEMYICFSKQYIIENFEEQILKNRSVIERRLYEEENSAEDFVENNQKVLQACEENELKYYVISEKYEENMDRVVEYFDKVCKKSLGQLCIE